MASIDFEEVKNGLLQDIELAELEAKLAEAKARAARFQAEAAESRLRLTAARTEARDQAVGNKKADA